MCVCVCVCVFVCGRRLLSPFCRDRRDCVCVYVYIHVCMYVCVCCVCVCVDTCVCGRRLLSPYCGDRFVCVCMCVHTYRYILHIHMCASDNDVEKKKTCRIYITYRDRCVCVYIRIYPWVYVQTFVRMCVYTYVFIVHARTYTCWMPIRVHVTYTYDVYVTHQHINIHSNLQLHTCTEHSRWCIYITYT